MKIRKIFEADDKKDKKGGGGFNKPALKNDHLEHAKLIGNKDFVNILQSNVDDGIKSKHLDHVLTHMQPEEKEQFIKKFHASYGEGGAPKWSAEVYNKHRKVIKPTEEPHKPSKVAGRLAKPKIEAEDGTEAKPAPKPKAEPKNESAQNRVDVIIEKYTK
jgi:hypothetical protein